MRAVTLCSRGGSCFGLDLAETALQLAYMCMHMTVTVNGIDGINDSGISDVVPVDRLQWKELE